MFDKFGLADTFLSRGCKVPSVALFLDGVKVAAVEFGELDTAFPFILSLPESETEKILTQKLGELGGEVERGLELTGLEQGDGSVRVRLRQTGDDDERVQEACWVVGTDGLHSAVRGTIADAFEGHDNPTLWAVVDARLEGWRHPGNAIAAELDRPGVNPIPLGDGRWRVYFRPETDDETTALAGVEAGLAAMSPGARLGERDQPRFFRTHSRVARRYRVGRVLIAGDAAHACSPIQGHGMNMGVQDAHNLGWKLALVVAGEAARELLDSYEAERRPVAQLIVRSGDKAEAGFDWQDPDSRRALVAELSTTGGMMGVAIAEAEITHGYSASPIVGEAGHLTDVHHRATAAGHRVGDVEGLVLAERACRLHELLRTPAHVLFVMLGDAEATRLDQALDLARTAARRYQPHVEAYVVTSGSSGPAALPPDVIRDPQGGLHERFAAERPCLCLVRPDGHLAVVSQSLSLDRLYDLLGKVLAPRG